ncbi:MAG: tetratricopeptide repeat protein [Candidatus Gastranaerophilales bacterium]|nr:tetratricopeptide repeat protein [Candidatus Gastranaerophilales bacterium]
MKKIFILFTVLTIFLSGINKCYAEKSFEDRKKDIIAVYNSNNLEEAYNMISKITEDERDYELWFLLGNLSQDFNNDTNASFFFQKSILLKPDFDKAHYNLANIYLKEKRYNSAINEYKLAIKYKKDFPYYYYNLGCAYLGLKDYKNAKNSFEKAIKLKSDEADFYYNLAYAYKNLNNNKEMNKAIEMYNNLKDKEET